MTSARQSGVPNTEDEALGLVEAGEAIGVPTAAILLRALPRPPWASLAASSGRVAG